MTETSNSHPESQAEDPGKRRRRLVLIGGAIVLVVAIAIVASALSSNSGDDAPAVDPAITKQQNYHQAQYAAGVSSGWPQTKDDRHAKGYLESSWHDPASVETTFVIDSRDSSESGPPMANAELARVQAQYLPRYHERGLKWVRLTGKPAVRWAYDVAGQAHLDYFLEECDTSLIIRGTTPPVAWEALAPFFRGMAATVTSNCE